MDIAVTNIGGMVIQIDNLLAVIEAVGASDANALDIAGIDSDQQIKLALGDLCCDGLGAGQECQTGGYAAVNRSSDLFAQRAQAFTDAEQRTDRIPIGKDMRNDQNRSGGENCLRRFSPLGFSCRVGHRLRLRPESPDWK